MPKGVGEQTGNPFAKKAAKGVGEQAAKPKVKKKAWIKAVAKKKKTVAKKKKK